MRVRPEVGRVMAENPTSERRENRTGPAIDCWTAVNRFGNRFVRGINRASTACGPCWRDCGHACLRLRLTARVKSGKVLFIC
jgi:hypothetical protein